MAKGPKSYKQRKEDFVSNHYGGTITEINLVTAVAPAAYILYAVLQSRLRYFVPYGPVQLAVDFLLNTLAILTAVTAYSTHPELLNLFLLTPALVIYLTTIRNVKKGPAKPPVVKKKNDNDEDKTVKPGQLVMPKKAFLTVYRGSMMVITCIAILAVDFKVFPRRFAKVENWGTSLMDLGVGSFVFSGGLVSARSTLNDLNALQQSLPRPSLPTRALAALRSSLPLFILGFIRLVSVKGIDYAEHITEYGYHWNFFFTLAFLPPFVTTFHTLLTTLLPRRALTYHAVPVVYGLLALAIATAYQAALSATGLGKFILIGERARYGLVGWNKEGIFSFAGYLAIFLAGVAAGGAVLPTTPPAASTTSSSSSSSSLKTKLRETLHAPSSHPAITLLLSTLLTSALFHVVTTTPALHMAVPYLGVSRRLANLPYALWVVSFNTGQLLAFQLVERLCFGAAPDAPSAAALRHDVAAPRVLRAFNAAGLPVFLVANVLTGLVNLGFNTLDMCAREALLVLVGYAAVVTGTALALEGGGWRRTAVGRVLGL